MYINRGTVGYIHTICAYSLAVLQVVYENDPARPPWGPHLTRICEGDQIEVFPSCGLGIWWIFQSQSGKKPFVPRQLLRPGRVEWSQRQQRKADVYFVGHPETLSPLERRVISVYEVHKKLTITFSEERLNICWSGLDLKSSSTTLVVTMKPVVRHHFFHDFRSCAELEWQEHKNSCWKGWCVTPGWLYNCTTRGTLHGKHMQTFSNKGVRWFRWL